MRIKYSLWNIIISTGSNLSVLSTPRYFRDCKKGKDLSVDNSQIRPTELHDIIQDAKRVLVGTKLKGSC